MQNNNAKGNVIVIACIFTNSRSLYARFIFRGVLILQKRPLHRQLKIYRWSKLQCTCVSGGYWAQFWKLVQITASEIFFAEISVRSRKKIINLIMKQIICSMIVSKQIFNLILKKASLITEISQVSRLWVSTCGTGGESQHHAEKSSELQQNPNHWDSLLFRIENRE